LKNWAERRGKIRQGETRGGPMGFGAAKRTAILTGGYRGGGKE